VEQLDAGGGAEGFQALPEAALHVIERIVARLGGLRERRGLGFQAETEPLRLHQVVITAKP
jgi:hypothetical protein